MTSSTSELYDGIAAGIYGGLLILAVAAYVYKLYREKWIFSLNSQAFISLFMVVFLALRVMYFGSQALGYSSQWDLFYINRISSILYFTGFTFVLFRWIHSLERKFSRPSALVARIVVVVALANVVVWFLEVACIVKYSIDEGSNSSPNSSARNKNVYFMFSTLLIAFINLFASVAFLLYGARLIWLIRTLKKRKLNTPQSKIYLIENKQEGGSFHFPSLHVQNETPRGDKEDERTPTGDESDDTQSLLGPIRIEGGEENAKEIELQRSLTRETIKVFVFTLVFTACFGFRGVLWAVYGFDDFELESELERIALYYIIPESIPSLFAIWLSRGRWHALPSANNDVTPHVIFPNPSEPHHFSSSFHISTSGSRDDSTKVSTTEFSNNLMNTSTSPFSATSPSDNNTTGSTYSFLKPSAAASILANRNNSNSSNFAISFSPPTATKTIEPQVLFSDDTPL
eukprot:TRINITY_DN3748_c0_g3_i2.p1 TRINITY_DN3748_c0_g3~~TRINITY_DN3748_c0_g3_i2.p1  ORF type:complete len:458 (-),score=106.03 TRINITY_DN3748_c0_g3_i2:140-1513(-)